MQDESKGSYSQTILQQRLRLCVWDYFQERYKELKRRQEYQNNGQKSLEQNVLQNFQLFKAQLLFLADTNYKNACVWG